MMNKPIFALTFTAPIFLVAACVGPLETQSTRFDTPSSVALQNAPDGAVLAIGSTRAVVDGGMASINVADGWHDAQVLLDGRAVITRRIFVQDGTAKIIDFTAP